MLCAAKFRLPNLIVKCPSRADPVGFVPEPLDTVQVWPVGRVNTVTLYAARGKGEDQPFADRDRASAITALRPERGESKNDAVLANMLVTQKSH